MLVGQATSGVYWSSVENDWKHLVAPQTLGKKFCSFFPGECKDSKLLMWKITYWIS
jgi:hypothetical protein